jgi:hypothetical protein
MARQPGHRDPLRTGIYRSLRRPDFTIDPVKWAAAAEAGDLVGECRRRGCPGYLVADDPPPADSPHARQDYYARCLYCDAEMVAPGGRTLLHSGAHSEAPGFWAGRAAQLRAAVNGG